MLLGFSVLIFEDTDAKEIGFGIGDVMLSLTPHLLQHIHFVVRHASVQDLVVAVDLAVELAPFDQLDQISLNNLHRLLEIFRNLFNINNLVGHDMLLQGFQPDLVEYLGVAMMTKEQIILETVTNLM